jgi:hypothetical protein
MLSLDEKAGSFPNTNRKRCLVCIANADKQSDDQLITPAIDFIYYYYDLAYQGRPF